MNKINKKITLLSLLTCGLLGASGGGDSSPQIDSNGLTSQAFSLVLKEGYFPSVSNFKTCGKAVGPIALEKLDEYKKYFRRQAILVTLHGNRNDKSAIEYINSIKEEFLTKIIDSIVQNNDPKIMPFKNSYWGKEYIQYIQDHLLDILMALTSDNPRVAALGLPSLDQIEDKERAIDQILDTLAPDLDQCDEDTENRLLARLINLTRDNPTVATLRLPTANEIQNKKQAINDILDIVCPIRIPYNGHILNIINSVHKVRNYHQNNMELIALIRRNRRNIEKFDDYYTLLYNHRDAQLKDFRPTAAIMQSSEIFIKYI